MKQGRLVAIFILLIIVLCGIFYAYSPNKLISDNNPSTKEVKAKVIEVDNSEVVKTNITSIGYQNLTVKILEGKFKNEIVPAGNGLIGQLDADSIYEPGDIIVAAVLEKENAIHSVKALDFYRQDWQLILFLLFVFSLILYGRLIGLKALFSFIASLFIIWYFLIPGLLKGNNPIALTVFIIMLLSGIIIFSVAGFTKKGVAAYTGTICGLLVTIIITLFFGQKLSLDGLTAPFASTLLFSGYLELNMLQIFYAAIIIGASGAAMDIAMDIATAMDEIKNKKPEIGFKELVQSGFTIGRAVIGTMTTTLLLAYSGGYLTLLMVFMSKNSSFTRIINLKIVSTEIMRTLVGSMGLVLVAPITAIISGYILTKDIKLKEIIKR